MRKLLNKLAPLGVMTVCTIWGCWTQLREATPLLAATEANLPRIQRKLLYPELRPASERDPFLQHKPAPPPIEKIELKKKVEEEPPFDPQTVLPSIRLDATMLGRRPLAVINGTIHNEGASIVLEAAPEVPCRLLRVRADGIVMTIDQHTFLIGYSNASKQVTEPTPDAGNAAQASRGTDDGLPEGVPHLDELESAVADALANQPPLTDDHDNLGSDQTDDLSTHKADEGCELERDLLNTNKFDELLNNHDE